MTTNNAMPAPAKSLDKVLAHIRAGGVAFVGVADFPDELEDRQARRITECLEDPRQIRPSDSRRVQVAPFSSILMRLS